MVPCQHTPWCLQQGDPAGHLQTLGTLVNDNHIKMADRKASTGKKEDPGKKSRKENCVAIVD